EKYIPPKKGKKHVMRVITEILSFVPEKKGTDIKVGLDFLNRVMKRKAICFLVSDFFSQDYEHPLKIAAKKNDLIALRIIDRHEVQLPNLGAIIHFEDAETGEELYIDTSDSSFIDEYQEHSEMELSSMETLFKKCNIDFIQFLTDKSYIKPIMLFFKKRGKRIRR
ncbi:VWA domain-containing protein, partial [bacterium]|nr:VWA domain-containing protein [bacterium]